MNRLWMLGVASLLLGCSSDDKTDGGTEGGSGMDSGGLDSGGKDSGATDSGTDSGGTMDSGADSGVDAGFMLNGCTDMSFVDRSGGVRAETWSLTPSTPFPWCFIISKGQSFTWNANPNFQAIGGHPLQPMGGDAMNPIVATNTGTTITFQFNNTGNFGFNCQNHPGIMQGVIRVKN